ncbi:response regulator transcription factor [Rubripirellula reticaptiva]|uniref:Transcriptional activator protein CopR n=1 Tax=Rubripirellula reticaptiva TaxID=2528013 RepID=A0A5C6EVA2_9BACT|nr:response regulator transcription factor [Rubripirellula reticaptiva]TWU51566.1 Transcriptional activator protein CopR [Rubripirellula reticaptiva]
MTRLIIVEDQVSLLKSLKKGLEEEGFEVMAASSGSEGYRLIQQEPADAVLLDLMLPDGDGISLLQRIREEDFQKPVLVITAKDSIDDRVLGLNSCADDYLVKPFAFSELLARLRAVLRRSPTSNFDTRLVYDDLVIDSLSRVASRNGRELKLTQRQFEMLEYLMRNKNRIVSRDALARDVWKAATATWTNVIEVQINQLRKKLGQESSVPVLHTVRGEGYQLGDEP